MTVEILSAGEREADTSILSTFADAERVLAANLPGYESRPQQQTMARHVEALFTRPENFPARDEDGTPVEPEPIRHALAQAGTGTGKSLGYLIPAILAAANDGRKVMVSVTTKALQDQIAGRDLPFLETHLGVDFSWALLKGRGNYLCLNRSADLTATEVPSIGAIRAAAEQPGFTGLREHLPQPVSDAEWRALASDADECSELDCSEGGCFALYAREAALEADVVLVNHALYFTNLALSVAAGMSFLPTPDVVIFDECHEIEEVAGNTLGGSISEGSFAALGSQVRNWVALQDGSADAEASALRAEAGRLFRALTPGRIKMEALNATAEHYGRVLDALGDLESVLAAVRVDRDDRKAKARKRSLTRRIGSLRGRIVQIVSDPFEDTVRWVEVERMRGGDERKVIRLAPVLVAPFLSEHLFSRVACVLTSATMTVNGEFTYLAGRLGIEHFDGIDVGTPFDYPRQGRLYVPAHLPEPVRNQVQMWESQATSEILNLIRTSRGRALVLFTSVKQMRSTFTSLVSVATGLELRMQGDAPVGDLIDWLREHDGEADGKVLFATKSFFTGVDVPGEALSLVIVVKMPFPVPTEPLTEARTEAIERAGGNAFRDYTIPVMSLVLQQAVGRLIRHGSDTGVVAVLDPRIITKGYGKQIVRDLPPMSLVLDPGDVRDFLAASAG